MRRRGPAYIGAGTAPTAAPRMERRALHRLRRNEQQLQARPAPFPAAARQLRRRTATATAARRFLRGRRKGGADGGCGLNYACAQVARSRRPAPLAARRQQASFTARSLPSGGATIESFLLQRFLLIITPRQSNRPSRKYHLRYCRAATIVCITPRPPNWPSCSPQRFHPDLARYTAINAEPV